MMDEEKMAMMLKYLDKLKDTTEVAKRQFPQDLDTIVRMATALLNMMSLNLEKGKNTSNGIDVK